MSAFNISIYIEIMSDYLQPNLVPMLSISQSKETCYVLQYSVVCYLPLSVSTTFTAQFLPSFTAAAATTSR